MYVYMDDVIISTSTHQTNIIYLKQTLQRFRKYKLKCNLQKTVFGSGRVEYLGYDISKEHGIRPGKMKTEAIKKCTPPTSVTEIKQFLGLCSFFRRVVPKFSEIAGPLTKLTRKSSGYKNGSLPSDAKSAFFNLQASLVTRPCVAPVDFNRPFILTVDTSQTAVGGILSQKGPDGHERACAYYSSLLSECDSRKSAFHREQLGILQALRHFKPYLFGKEFLLRTDHKPLAINSTGKLDVLDRIGEAIKQFQPFKMEYMKGSVIPADYLSRPNLATSQKLQINCLEKQFKPSFISLEQVKDGQTKDSRIRALVIRLETKKWPQAEILKSFVQTWAKSCKFQNGLLTDKNNRIFVPQSLKSAILENYHDKAGHKGAETTISLISQNWTWPEMRKDVENYVRSCDVCCQAKPPHEYKKVPLREFQEAKYFNQRLHIDCLTNLPLSKSKNHSCVVIIADAYSGYCLTKSISRPNAAEVAEILMNDWISKFSSPSQLISDGGREFQNNMIKELCQKMNIEQIITSPYHSRSNGLAERKVRQLVEFLRLYTHPGRTGQQEWDQLLPYFDLFTNIAKNVRGFSPHFLVFLNEPRLPADLFSLEKNYSETDLATRLRMMNQVADFVRKNQKLQFERNKKYHDRKCI